jgi:hypothetical protein
MSSPFNFEKAKRGAPVELKNGMPVRILCFDFKSYYPIIGAVLDIDGTEFIVAWDINGNPNQTYLALDCYLLMTSTQ